MTNDLPDSTASPVGAPPCEPCGWGWPACAAQTLYLGAASALCLWLAAWMPTEGPPTCACLPPAAAVLRLRSGDGAWQAWESHPVCRTLWREDSFPLREALTRLQEQAARRPAWSQRLVPLNRRGLRFLVESEVALAALPPPATAARESPGAPRVPLLLLLRLSGAKGALLRMAAPYLLRERRGLSWHDLGGGLVALGLNGAQPHFPGDPDAVLAAEPLRPQTQAELVLRPRSLMGEEQHPWRGLFETPAPWPEVFGLAEPPEEIRLEIRGSDGGLLADGRWTGRVPAAAPAAPLLDPAPQRATAEERPSPPLLEAVLPFDARAAFLRWVEDERRSEKGRRRWDERFARLAAAGGDLDRDFWPAVGRTLAVQVAPAPEGASASPALVLLSLPFRNDERHRRILGQAVAVCGKGLYLGDVAQGAKRPYARCVSHGDADDYLWVSKGLRPAWRVGPEGWSFLSDTSYLGLTPLPLRLAQPPQPAEVPHPALRLRSHGARLAPVVGALVQMWLDDQRDEMGAADFMAAYPDPAAAVRRAETLARFSGELNLEVTPVSSRRDEGHVHLEWRPE